MYLFKDWFLQSPAIVDTARAAVLIIHGTSESVEGLADWLESVLGPKKFIGSVEGLVLRLSDD